MLQEKALRSLKGLFAKGQVFTDAATLVSYEVDAGLDKGRPDGVVFPHAVEDVERLVQWAAEYHAPLVARGAGTGLSGGAVADQGGVIVEFSRMNRVLAIDLVGRRAVVQPAVINLALDEQVKMHDLYFPPDPASQRASTVGGNVAENSGGPHCFKYGVTTNYVIGMEVVLADGKRIHVGGQALDYPEYDLCGLITGSEGMLAIITSIAVRLLRNPPGIKTMLAIFRSVKEAGAAVSAVISSGLVPATLELMDQKIIGIVEPYAHANLPLDAGAVLVIDVDGYAESLDTQVSEMEHLMRAHGAYEIRTSSNADERAKIWLARKSVAGAVTRLAPSYYTVDVTVPRSRLAEVLIEVDAICERYGVRTGYLLHAGDGNLHPMMLIPNPDDPAYMQRVHRAGWEMVKCCVEMGGSLTGEHGVGIEKREYMSLMHTANELLAMWDVKQVFDAQGIVNPGKVFPHPKSAMSGPYEGYAVLAAPTGGMEAANRQLFTPATAEEAAHTLTLLAAANRQTFISGQASQEKRELSTVMAFGNTKAASDALLTSQVVLAEKRGPLQDAAILSTRGLRGVKTYAAEDLYITVGAGTPLREVQEFLAKDRMQVPLASPWPDATIGGIVSSNSNAPLRMRYGAIRDLVLCGTVALTDGRVIRVGRPIVKNVAGYDLTKAFIGSYGTLGLWTDITFKVLALPRISRTLLYAVEDLSQGLAWSQKIFPLSLVASAVVLCKGHEKLKHAELPRSPYLLVYTAEGLREDVEAELQQVRRALNGAGGPPPVEIENYTGTDIWRELLAEETNVALQVRVGIPVRSLSAYVQSQSASLNAGSLVIDHANGFVYASNATTKDAAASAWLESLRKPTLEAQGYAVVINQPEALQGSLDWWGYRPEGIDIMQALKQRWDKQNILNPGVFIM